MIDLPLIFVGGLLGSAHCIGMCGPLAVALSAGAPAGSRLLARQLAFGCGRIFTYGFCGAAAGLGGRWIAERGGGFINSQATLAIVAGVVLIVMGLTTAGVVPQPKFRWLSGAPCGAASWLKTLFGSSAWSGPILAGVFTGFIPCGLVYAFLFKAASAGSVWLGWLTMAAFGLGTIPMMTTIGYGGRLLSGAGRARLFHVAAWCIVLTGAISIARGAGQLGRADAPEPAPCPLCELESAAGGYVGGP